MKSLLALLFQFVRGGAGALCLIGAYGGGLVFFEEMRAVDSVSIAIGIWKLVTLVVFGVSAIFANLKSRLSFGALFFSSVSLIGVVLFASGGATDSDKTILLACCAIGLFGSLPFFFWNRIRARLETRDVAEEF